MAREFPIPDEAYKKKKVVVIICAVLLILLCMSLQIGREGGLIGTQTSSPTVVAVITTPPPTTTAPPTVTSTETSLPTATLVVSTVEPPTPVPTDTASPPTVTPRPSTPTLPPSPTPAPPTPTPSLSPTSLPTPTPTATPTSPRPPVIENPADGSELPSEGLKVEGTAEPGATVEVYTGDTSLGKVPVDESGNWSLLPVEGLSTGDHTIVAVDVATNQTSSPVTFTLVEAWLPVTGSGNK